MLRTLAITTTDGVPVTVPNRSKLIVFVVTETLARSILMYFPFGIVPVSGPPVIVIAVSATTIILASMIVCPERLLNAHSSLPDVLILNFPVDGTVCVYCLVAM